MAGLGGLPGLDSLSASDKDAVMKELNSMQVMESLTTYNGLVERCFGECVTHFRAKMLDDSETACVKNCVQKYMQFSQRIGQKFAEKNQQMSTASQ